MGRGLGSRERRVCGRRGHLTYRPHEVEVAARLQASTAHGAAWRCLRCGDWAVGPPAASGPAAEAPIPPRGKALRQQTLLRVLAIERMVRAVVLVIAAYGVEHFASAQQSLRRSFEDVLPSARPLASRLGFDLDNSVIVRETTKALDAKHSTLVLVAVALLAYGLLEGVEGVGLWLAKRWGEYLTVVATAAFLPLEVWELHDHPTVTKAATFAINLAAVGYLVVAKRLFGVRGGGPAYEAELRSESLLDASPLTPEQV
ncbi:MAG TPA: DUF2127 domain-containing protein [Sporichthyaceae bacterium]|jgi:uncharacterized membrane protein (DUF2068 family)|nr:DUF2127 domain-containing protein [Sporichthyaceae bacterium]